jgi:hypothetical protein
LASILLDETDFIKFSSQLRTKKNYAKADLTILDDMLEVLLGEFHLLNLFCGNLVDVDTFIASVRDIPKIEILARGYVDNLTCTRKANPVNELANCIAPFLNKSITKQTKTLMNTDIGKCVTNTLPKKREIVEIVSICFIVG